jgi:hypothetical protein
MFKNSARLITSEVIGYLLDAGMKRVGEARLITRGIDKAPYFYRFYITPEDRDEEASVGYFIHKFVGSDPFEEVHSHPWEWCFSIILAGSYTEVRYKYEKLNSSEPAAIRLYDKKTRVLAPFDMNIIMHDDMHRVDLHGDACWTLFVHGPRRSTWGFANENTGAFREITRRTKDLPKANF